MTEHKILATLIAIAAIMIGLLVWAFNQPKDCWQQYQTEQEAIQHCEGQQ